MVRAVTLGEKTVRCIILYSYVHKKLPIQSLLLKSIVTSKPGPIRLHSLRAWNTSNTQEAKYHTDCRPWCLVLTSSGSVWDTCTELVLTCHSKEKTNPRLPWCWGGVTPWHSPGIPSSRQMLSKDNAIVLGSQLQSFTRCKRYKALTCFRNTKVAVRLSYAEDKRVSPSL